jgi:hypothetical protein
MFRAEPSATLSETAPAVISEEEEDDAYGAGE